MSKETAGQSGYLKTLEVLREKQHETDDPKENQRIQGLIDAQLDSQAMEELLGQLKTEEAKRLVSRASLAYIIKHYLDLTAFSHERQAE
jgi:hypothetical protein